MKQKKLMLLGGISYLVPIIKKAHEMGVYVITCDFLPDNIAHKYSDEYVNASIIDKDAVLEKAKELEIDGIMSFACDPGVVTASYVAEQMGLPFQTSYEATCILQNKGKFREFLRKNGFNVPNSKSYNSMDEVMMDADNFEYPIIVKPVDSAGSKGVTKVEKEEDLKHAVTRAFDYTISGSIVIEDFLELDGYQNSTDPFVVDGEFAFYPFSDNDFDRKSNNEFVPTEVIFPCTMDPKYVKELKDETARLMKLLNVKTGIFNIESRLCTNGKTYLMEVTPRGGGNRIAELQDYAFNTHCVENEIRKALNMELIPFEADVIDGCWMGYAVHSVDQEGILDCVEIDPSFMDKYVKDVFISANKGDKVSTMEGANCELGDLIMHFSSREECCEVMSSIDKWVKIKLEK